MGYSQAITGVVLQRGSPAAAASDDVILKAIAAGDRNAMRALYTRHNVRVFRYLRHFVGNAATAEDLVSETFFEVWRQASRYEGRSQVTSWILGIARFKALSALRQRSFDGLDDRAATSIEDPADGPEAVAQARERNVILRDCIAQLSPAHREVIDLVYYHERSLGEVARIIGVPENTVKTRVFHARKRLAELMHERGLDRSSL